MADYPDLPISPQSTANPISGLIFNRGVDGTLRAQNVHTTKLDFNIIHEVLTDTERSTLVDFYNSNKDVVFNFTWPIDNVTYTCLFKSRPKFTSIGQGKYVNATCSFGEV